MIEVMEKLVAIAENEHKVYEAGYQKAVEDCATQVVEGSVSGTIVSMKDVSPIEHEIEVKASSQNIIPYPYFNTTKTVAGITFTDNGDGSITVNGTAGATAAVFYFTDSKSTADIGDLFEDGETYKISSVSGAVVFVLQIYNLADNSPIYKYGGNTFTVDKSKYRYSHMRIQVTNTTVDNITVYPMVKEGTESTPYTSYVDVSKAKLIKQGKNWLAYPYNELVGQKGITVTKNDDGSVLLNGTSTDSQVVNFNFHWRNPITLPAGDYTIGGIISMGCYLVLQNATDGGYQYTQTKNITVSFTKETKIRLCIQIVGNAVLNNVLIKPFIVSGDYDGTWEPYIEPIEYPISADGTVEGVTSLYPTTTLYSDTEGVLIEATYNKDVNKVIDELEQKIIDLGGSV